jgi:hypothetical protein
MGRAFFIESRYFSEIYVDLLKKLSITPHLLHKRSPSVEWWNWQTRMFKGHVPKGVGVQVPLRPRGLNLELISVDEASQTQ